MNLVDGLGVATTRFRNRARKYLGDPRFGDPKKVYLAAYQRLGQVAASMDCRLVQDLAIDMESTVEQMDDGISFLANDGPEKKSRDAVIIYAQAWLFASTDQAKEFAKAHGCPAETTCDFVEWIALNYDWPEKIDPIPRWRARFESLAKESDEHRTLKQYCNFMKQTENIRSQITESAAQLDAYIQLQIDIARGK